ncbi:MAG: ABATE domain-containing protein [Acidobacteria bacterium]|nr:ABATE domain-containing protein [Acidobacteriota bacterium]
MIPMTEVRDGFKFRGGSLPLDFAATLAARLRAEPRELLATPRDLGRWFVAAGLTEKAVRVAEHDLVGARELREALYELARARARGKAGSDADRRIVNRHAAAETPVPQLEENGLRWTHVAATSLLALLARAGIDLLSGAMRDRIRQCSGEGCAILFVDTSRSGHRKWCSMAGCGNKAKVATFRERNRGD